MKCPECGNEMIISEWDGWIWMCFFCDYQGKTATDDECLEYEKKQNEYFEQVLKGNE